MKVVGEEIVNGMLTNSCRLAQQKVAATIPLASPAETAPMQIVESTPQPVQGKRKRASAAQCS